MTGALHGRSFFLRQSLAYAVRSAGHASGEWPIRVHEAPERSGAVLADPHQMSLNGDGAAGIRSILPCQRLSYAGNIGQLARRRGPEHPRDHVFAGDQQAGRPRSDTCRCRIASGKATHGSRDRTKRQKATKPAGIRRLCSSQGCPAAQAAGRIRICFFLPSDSLMTPSAVISPLPMTLRSSLTASSLMRTAPP